MSQLKEFLFVTFLFSVILLITKVHSLDPKTVDPQVKGTWCSDQFATCNNICLDNNNQVATTNYCNPDDLSFDCVCSNGTRPNSTEYTQTIPYYTCTYDQQACIAKCSPATDACVKACKPTNCSATVVTKPGTIPQTVPGSSSPSQSGPSGPPPPSNPLGGATTSSPMGGYYILFVLVTTCFYINLV